MQPIPSEAGKALAEERYHRAVRRAQESVKLSLKAALRLLGMEYPREHDVSDVLSEVARHRDLPEWFRSELNAINIISKELAERIARHSTVTRGHSSRPDSSTRERTLRRQ